MRQASSRPGRASLRTLVQACAALLLLTYTTVFSAASMQAQSTAGATASLPRRDTRLKVELQGEVNRGQEWRASIGQGWTFRVLPIAGAPIAGAEYSGWDLAIDRDGNYPDALLLATPPYGSLNQREIGTTFGLRAQDAIAWQPRKFHFLTSEKDLKQARGLYHAVMAGSAQSRQAVSPASSSLLAIIADRRRVSAGEFTVLDAKLIAGVADPPPYAAQWATQLQQLPHTLIPSSGKPSPLGQLAWIRFRITLWLPAGWRPHEQRTESVKCAE